MITEITEDIFNCMDPINQVIVYENPRRFASIHLPRASSHLGVCWESNLIDLTLVEDKVRSVVWFGVDDRLVCVALNGSIRLSMILPSNLLDIKILPEFVFVLCETDFLVFNHNGLIRFRDFSADFFASVEVQDGKVIVSLLDGGYRFYPT